jgi:hypothetical protein
MKHPDLDFKDRGPDVEIAKAMLNSQGFRAGTGPVFDELMRDAVVSFQASHVGSDGKPLKAIGRVGQRTWWALYNPSGPAQRAFMELTPGAKPFVCDPKSDRGRVLSAGLKLWREGVREIPDGSNWGDGVSKVLANAGGPRFWCCHLIGHVFMLGTGEYLWEKDWGLVMGLWNEAKRRGCAFEKSSGYVPRPCDLGVTLYRNSKGRLTGSGHIWFNVNLGPKSGRGRDYNHLGGNEGNRLKLGIRNTADESLFGWINPFGDGPGTEVCEVLPFQRNAEKAAAAFAATR